MHNAQRGGIISFVVVAVVLAGLLAGGIYFSKQQGREARNNTPAPQIAERDEEVAEERADEPATQPEGGTTREASPQTPAPTAPQQSRSGTTESPGSTTDRVATTGPSDIPSTGPAGTVAATVALAGLTFGLYRHASSRRSLRDAALRK